MINSFDLSLFIDELEIISILIAGLSHDVGHDGFTNAFHVNANTNFALKYNEQSVLEN